MFLSRGGQNKGKIRSGRGWDQLWQCRLYPFPGRTAKHRTPQICTHDIAGRDSRSPIGTTGALPWVGENISP